MNTATTDYKPLAPQQWLSPNIWPFQSFLVDTGGVDIAVTDVGRGPVLLFVHTGAWSFIWRDLMERLANDFRLHLL
jgi:haloalkane dehalogenase